MFFFFWFFFFWGFLNYCFAKLAPLMSSLYLCVIVSCGFHRWFQCRISDSIFWLLMLVQDTIWKDWGWFAFVRFYLDFGFSCVYLVLNSWQIYMRGIRVSCGFALVAPEEPFGVFWFGWGTFFDRITILCIKCSHPCIRKLLHLRVKHDLPQTILVSLFELFIFVFEWRWFWRSINWHLSHLHAFSNIWWQLKFFFRLNLVCGLVQVVITALVWSNTWRN